MQKTLEFPRVAAIATSAVVVAGAFAITPVTTDIAAPRSMTADVALADAISCAPDGGGCIWGGSGPPEVAYSNLFAPFTQEAIDWIADPGLNGWWNVEPATPSDENTYALRQAANGRWVLSAPTGAADEELVKLVAAAAGQGGWTLQHPSASDPIPGDPTWYVTPIVVVGPGSICVTLRPDGCQPSVAGVGALTAAIANPLPIFRQILNNMVAYAGLLGTVPLEAAVAKIVATVAAHIKAVGEAAEGLIPRAIEGEIKRNQAFLSAVQKAVGYVAEELTTNFGSGNAVKAFRAGFLSTRGYDGTVASSLPGTFLAATTGPGIIANPAACIGVPLSDCSRASVAVEMQGARGRFVNALGGINGQPVPSCGRTSFGPPCGTVAPQAELPRMSQPAATKSTNIRAAAARTAAATTSAAVDSVADVTADSVADSAAASTASASTETARKPAGTHRASRSAASRAAAS